MLTNKKELQKLSDRFIKNLTTEKKSKNTISQYTKNMETFIESLDTMEEDQFEIMDAVFNYIDSLDAAYSISTINNKRSTIKSFLKFLYMRRHIGMDLSGHVRNLPKEKGKTKEVLSKDEIKRIYKKLDEYIKLDPCYLNKRNKMLFTFLVFTGCRASELVNLKWTDIDIAEKIITIRQSKGNKTREIPMTTLVVVELQKFIKSQKNENGKMGMVFRNHLGDKLTRQGLEDIVGRIMKDARIRKNISPHSMRHTFASHAIDGGMAITTLAGILGHGSPTTTMNIYAHEISMKQRFREMEKMDSII